MTTTRCRVRLVTIVAVLAAGTVGGNAQAGTATAVLRQTIPSSIGIPAQAWVDVTDRPSGISVKLPGKATTGTASRPLGNQTIKGRFYQVETGGNRVTFIVYDVPGTPQNLDLLLQGYGTSAKVTNQTTTSTGLNIRDARVMHEDEHDAYLVRFVGAKSRVVQLVAVGPIANEKTVTQMHQQLLASVRIPS